ncbi:DNA methyltransferase [Nostoc sp. FACHB-133]|uniref:DNA methyltransferase n=1 Tax=Nostoc sp. FACHB-133 TaxID=2692835 RepID=UPI0016869647|nr:DNA methyltransferase [Nostoc sp. FACHB-133]MBD2526578.1 DNA methylase [Nostoc sp. FACHB-133]
MEGQQLPLDIQLNTNSEEKGAVECLGMTFESDEARRAYFIEKLREKLQDPEFRQIEGFPIGEDEDILALSDPPYYTACPNPFIEDFINYWNLEKDNNSSSDTDEYHREPFAADVSEGKNDPIYNAHSYHTKVPHKAIMRYILHYTEPGNIIFDGFCGTGMTGVAAQLCGDKATVESLGYKVQTDGTILDEEGKTFSKLGARRAILNDLSPAATFIAYNYNTPVDVVEFEKEAKLILAEVEKECGWMYLTLHNPNPEQIGRGVSLLKESNNLQVDIQNSRLSFGKINYTVWSDVFTCPECADEVVFWEVAIDKAAGKVLDDFPCPQCNAQLKKRNMERTWITRFDSVINQNVKQAKQVPVLIIYNLGNKRFEKIPDKFDLALIQKHENTDIPYWVPTDILPKGYNTEQPRNSHGVTHAHHFYTTRNLHILTLFIEKLHRAKLNQRKLFILTGAIPDLIKCARLRIGAYFHGGRGVVSAGVSGTLYIPSLSIEKSVLFGINNRFKTFQSIFNKKNIERLQIIGTESTSNFNAPDNTVDYIFTDPPFGGNLMYSELNFIWEVWLKVLTNNKPEAIENKTQGKGIAEYQDLMGRCFHEYYRVLKPGRWMTVEFHNSHNSIWNAIQEAMQYAGFVIADVRTLDKKQSSFKQVTSSNATKQDLILSAYKPITTFEEKFKLEAGTEEACWEFIRNHLQKLPRFVPKDGKAETIAERQNYLLFDRMVAFHIQRGATVPLSASEFYAGLAQRFTNRDEMYFLPEQVAEYDKKRLTVKEILQLELVIVNEETAIQWLRQELTKKPQSRQDIFNPFMRSKVAWPKLENSLELDEILDQNFLCYEGKGPIPKQIVSWLKQSSIHRDKIYKIEGNLPPDAIGLETDDPTIIRDAKDKWYVPDPYQAIDLEKLREKSLLREFEEYRQSKQKKLTKFRLEAVLAGFAKAWKDKHPQIIVDVANKIPENMLQEDQKLLRFYDNALNRLEE